MFLTLKKWTEKNPGTTRNKIWIPQIENPGTIFKYFLGDDGLFEWSDVLKICMLGEERFIIRIQGGEEQGWGSKYRIFWSNIFLIGPYHKV